MKKYIVLIIILVGYSVSVSAQNMSLKKTNKLFKMKAYAEAAQAYEAQERSQQVLENLADSYYYTWQMQKATKTYRELFLTYSDSLDLELHFRYAEALKGVQNYKEADRFLKKYYNKKINTLATLEENKKTTPHIFKAKPIDNQGSNQDFGMTFYDKNKVAFASARNSSGKNYVWNNTNYLDLYSATITSSGKLTDIKPFPASINTDTHESNATFTNDGKTMYFNRTNIKRTKIEDDKVANIKIYRAEKVGDSTWTNVVALPFNSDLYNVEHPTLSKDEKTLYFASDMPGTIGDFDIYKVAIDADNSYGPPVNLGSQVNTKHREQFPYVSDINTLYFSSNGHLGYGALDVYRSEMVNGNFSKPVNLGNTVNSHLDDFGYSIYEKENKGYFSSNRRGSDELYGFVREENILTKYLVEGLVQDKNNKKLVPGVLVTLLDEMGKVIKDTIVKQNAHYMFKVEPNKKYTLRTKQKLYIPTDVEFSTNSKGKIQQKINLSIESYKDADARIQENKKGDVQINLERIYFDYDKSNIRPDAASILNNLVNIMNQYPQMEVQVSAHTDARAGNDYNLNLSKSRAASTLEYVVSQGINRNRLRSIGYGEEQPLNQCTEEKMCTDQEYEINRRCEFTILK